MNNPVVSLHPHFVGDVNWAPKIGRGFSGSESAILRSARCVVVSQAVSLRCYEEILSLCPRVFPDYRLRHRFQGKAGCAAFTEKFNFPSPKTKVYRSVKEFSFLHPHPSAPPFAYPFVLKANDGGGGNGVFCARTPAELKKILCVLDNDRIFPQKSLVAQEFVRHEGSDLRVVILGDGLHTYWRVQERAGEFRNNVGQGAKIVHEKNPELTRLGMDLAADIRERSGINCAAVDIAFDQGSPVALLMEINFVFGRKGIGGTERFRGLFGKAANQWIRFHF